MKADFESKDAANRRFADPRVVEFKPRPRPTKSIGAATTMFHRLRRPEIGGDRVRTQQNLAAAIALALLLAAGLWLVHELRTSSQALACLEAGHAHCSAIDGQGGWLP